MLLEDGENCIDRPLVAFHPLADVLNHREPRAHLRDAIRGRRPDCSAVRDERVADRNELSQKFVIEFDLVLEKRPGKTGEGPLYHSMAFATRDR